MKNVRSGLGILLFLFLLFPLLFTGCSKKAPPSKSADQVVKDTAQGLARHEPKVLWEALPKRYQKDIEGIVHEMAGKMDKELWNKAFALIDKIVMVLKTKKDLLLSGEMLQKSAVDAKKLSNQWDNIVGTAEVFTKSELADLEKLKHLDIAKFLAGTGADFMKKAQTLSDLEEDGKYGKAFDKLSTVKTSVIQSQKDTATVKIEIPDEGSWEIVFIKVEEKWVPKSLADEWDAKIAEVKKELAEISAGLSAEEKQKILGMMTSIDGILDQMLAAKTSQDLESTVGQAIGMLLGMALGKG